MQDKMNHMYRWMRHIYDASRKHYLLGRDELIHQLSAQKGQHICEVGCGTARNLIKLHKQYPEAHFYGLDVSDEMLKTARHSLKKYKLEHEIKIIQADADSFGAQEEFGLAEKFDAIIFSYTLSLVPYWQACIEHGLTQLKEGGTLYILDFTSEKSHPLWMRKIVAPAFKMFQTYFKTGIEQHLKHMEDQNLGRLVSITQIKNRSCIAVFCKK